MTPQHREQARLRSRAGMPATAPSATAPGSAHHPSTHWHGPAPSSAWTNYATAFRPGGIPLQHRWHPPTALLAWPRATCRNRPATIPVPRPGSRSRSSQRARGSVLCEDGVEVLRYKVCGFAVTAGLSRPPASCRHLVRAGPARACDAALDRSPHFPRPPRPRPGRKRTCPAAGSLARDFQS